MNIYIFVALKDGWVVFWISCPISSSAMGTNSGDNCVRHAQKRIRLVFKSAIITALYSHSMLSYQTFNIPKYRLSNKLSLQDPTSTPTFASRSSDFLAQSLVPDDRRLTSHASNNTFADRRAYF